MFRPSGRSLAGRPLFSRRGAATLFPGCRWAAPTFLPTAAPASALAPPHGLLCCPLSLSARVLPAALPPLPHPVAALPTAPRTPHPAGPDAPALADPAPRQVHGFNRGPPDPAGLGRPAQALCQGAEGGGLRAGGRQDARRGAAEAVQGQQGMLACRSGCACMLQRPTSFTPAPSSACPLLLSTRCGRASTDAPWTRPTSSRRRRRPRRSC